VGVLRNLAAVTLGNIVGGSLMVAMVYYLIYRRRPLAESGNTRGRKPGPE
jgi:formate/nitrite transporter FocA (FNT family)